RLTTKTLFSKRGSRLPIRTFPPATRRSEFAISTDQIYVTYAVQDAKKHDDVAGLGNGIVNVFDTSGNLFKRLISNGNLNAPWGLALDEATTLGVGTCGHAKIKNTDPTSGAPLGRFSKADGTPLQFDGLWDMLPLGGGVYFTAGIADEEHGLFGKITE